MVKKILLLFLVLNPLFFFGKKPDNNKEDNAPLSTIKSDIATLCSERFEGRLTGTDGDALSANFIESRFRAINIDGYKNKYQWDYNFKGGVRIGSNAWFKVFENKLVLGSEVIFLPYGKGNTISGSAMPNVNEPDNVWLIPISQLKLKSTNKPQKILRDYAADCAARSANAVLFLNDGDESQDLSMANLENFDQVSVPVAFLNYKPYQAYVKPALKGDWIVVDGKLGYENANVVSRNVIACIDNKAPLNIVITAHYDHIGNTGGLLKGADNNASGVAALLATAAMIKANNLKRFNYIFIAFSGHEADFQGAKAFVQQNEFMLNAISCVISLDGAGRLDPTKKDLFLNGVGTSPGWGPLLQKVNKGFLYNIDSAGVGYGDYNFFYYKNIPVLNISTGYTDDYHRMSDDESKLNFAGIYEVASLVFRLSAELDKQTKMIFNLTRNIVPELRKLKSDIGVIHDLSFNQNGCRVATTLPDSKAAKAGMLKGDVIIKIGAFPIIDIDDYIEAIDKSATGKEVTIVVKRGKIDYKFFVVI